MSLVLILLAVIVFIVYATAKLKLDAFFVLLLAAFLAAFAYQIPLNEIASTITKGFGGILGYIGLVIVLGTIIGVLLEKSGAAIAMVDFIIRIIGDRFPKLTMTIIGYIVSIPVFCDSGFIIINSLKESMAARVKVSSVAMSVALATGLYATHTFVPPTPGPIAAAGNLGLSSNLGMVIMVGLVVAAVSALVGTWWASRFDDVEPDIPAEDDAIISMEQDWQALRDSFGKIPSATAAFSPIVVPILLIALGSVAQFPSRPFGSGLALDIFIFISNPLTALFIGVLLAIPLLQSEHKVSEFSDHVKAGIVAAAPILLITGAGGAFGSVLSSSPLGGYLGDTLSSLGIGIFMPFIVAAALKTAQGSSTVSLVTTSAMVAPLLPQLGLDSEMGRVLTVMAIGAGAMTVSHANDSFFWVVSQFSRMSVGLAYRAQTMATLVQGVVAMFATYILSLILL